MPRAGFTLIEVLVSIMIFAVVSAAMLTVFTLSTRVFRDTEAARIAADEAQAALAALDEDLQRLVPVAAGGWLYAGVHDAAGNGGVADDGGTMVVAFLADAGSERRLVAWWSDERGRLRRHTAAATAATAWTTLTALYQDAAAPVVATGCLYFAADIATSTQPRATAGPTVFAWRRSGAVPAPAWDAAAADALWPGPGVDDYVRSDLPALSGIPTALRLSLVLVGGDPGGTGFTSAKEAPVGFVVEDQGGTIRTGGLRTLPVAPGALVRIGDPGVDPAVEWIAYDGFQGGRLQVAADGRGQRRTAQATHRRGEAIRSGRTWTLVRELPR